jgi:glycosyltransferase involved in cell wall biosynthesis
MSRATPVSAVIITRNAERLLGRVLDALRWCDEILIVDSGSTDSTIPIARIAGAAVIEKHDFEGFGPQKAFAVSQARNDWVFVVDGDEIVTEELRGEIEARVGRGADERFVGFEVPISLVFLGRLMRHGGEYRMPHLRLFDRRHGNYNANRVHERVELDGPVGRLEHHMLHDSYASLEAYFEKFNQYSTAAAADLAARGRSAGVLTIALRLPLTFLRQYILRLHVLNGYPGFLWSLLSAFYPVVKYAKLRELRRAK